MDAKGTTAFVKALESRKESTLTTNQALFGGGGGGELQGGASFLNKLRTSVSDSPEFRALAARLYSGVRDALRDENLPSFGTLERGDQEALVNRVRGTMLDEEVYGRCRDATWGCPPLGTKKVLGMPRSAA